MRSLEAWKTSEEEDAECQKRKKSRDSSTGKERQRKKKKEVTTDTSGRGRNGQRLRCIKLHSQSSGRSEAMTLLRPTKWLVSGAVGQRAKFSSSGLRLSLVSTNSKE